MKCPNCSFDIQEKIESCPFCNFNIPKPPDPEAVDAPPAAGIIGSLAETSAEPEASKHGFSSDPNDPLAAPVGYDDPYKEGGSEPLPEDLQASFSAPKAERALGALLPIAGLAGVFFAHQAGVFDSILITAGFKAAPAADLVPAPPSANAPQPPSGPKQDDPVGYPATAVKPSAAVVVPEETSDAAEWRFYGRVFDMFTLEPIAGVELSFMGGESEEEMTAKTDAKGQYKVQLPALIEVIGYEIIIDKPGYHDGYVIDKKLDFKNLSPKQRNQLITKAGKEKPWNAESSKWQRRDLGLFPAR